MITDDKITEIFCATDSSCILLIKIRKMTANFRFGEI